MAAGPTPFTADYLLEPRRALLLPYRACQFLEGGGERQDHWAAAVGVDGGRGTGIAKGTMHLI